VVAVGDQATGTTALRDIYAEMAEAPGDVDLDALWLELGIVSSGKGLTFDDSAPLAHVRRGITQAP
jgi:hypothetical protein